MAQPEFRGYYPINMQQKSDEFRTFKALFTTFTRVQKAKTIALIIIVKPTLYNNTLLINSFCS